MDRGMRIKTARFLKYTVVLGLCACAFIIIFHGVAQPTISIQSNLHYHQTVFPDNKEKTDSGSNNIAAAVNAIADKQEATKANEAPAIKPTPPGFPNAEEKSKNNLGPNSDVAAENGIADTQEGAKAAEAPAIKPTPPVLPIEKEKSKEHNRSKSGVAAEKGVADGQEEAKAPAEAPAIKPAHPGVDIGAWGSALRAHSSADRWVVLALADQGCVDMAVSFHQTSLRPHHIHNYLIIGSDNMTCALLEKYQINCYTYMVDKAAGRASVYHSKDFLRKMNIRTYMILDALRLGFNVLHTDLDMYFMKNPFQDFDYQKGSYDLAPLMDMSSYNAGFLFIRNSTAAIKVYKASAHIADTRPKIDDQLALNSGIRSVKEAKITRLSKQKYQCGKLYWNLGKRNFIEDKPCSKCVVVHDNWIVSMEAKRYRLREMGMWAADIGGYYSDVNRTYLVYDNEVILKDNAKEDLKALENALAIGAILNRTVILPKFHCNGKRCTLLDRLLVRKFEKYFPNYREHSFLQNPLVPEKIRNSTSSLQIITSETYIEINERDKRPEQPDVQVYQPLDVVKGACSDEIISWFGNKKDAVLRFDNMLGSFCCFSDKGKHKQFQDKVKAGFKHGKYLQM